MKTLSTRRARAVIVALAAGSLALTGCSSGGGTGKDKSQTDQDAAAQSKVVPLGTAAQSQGPAAPVAGATPGGTITVYQRDSFNHLDPAQMYVSDMRQLAKLIFRGLTTYKQDDKGHQTLVGDLATDAGKMSDGGKTWTYTLKDGITFEDGQPITSKDIRHTIERTYAPFITEGPTYVQQWLSGAGSAYRKALPDGPYKGDHLPKSVLDTPDDKTIVFHFDKPQTQLPYALAQAGYSAVPDSAKDTKDSYDVKPVCAGPYKIASFKAGKSMELVRNPKWNPKTDPVRQQYPDGYSISFNHQYSDYTKRLMADQGVDKTAIGFSNLVEPSLTRQVLTDGSASKRTVQGYAVYVWQMNMNMDRIKDKRIRDAITYAMPNAQIVRINGGSYGGENAGGLFSPTVAGYEKGYDPYGKLKKPNGDPEKAKQLLKEAGKEGMKLVYAYANTEIRQQEAVAIADALGKAGFNVQKKEVDAASWYQQMSKVDNGYDIYMTGWGQDWADASTVIPPSYDGRTISDGASNYSHVRDKHISDEIDKIQQMTDAKKQTEEWQKLHHYIVEKVDPASPIYFTKVLQLYGSKIGGIRYNIEAGYLDVNTLFVKK
ncbi:ABC transporter substrate-binding protein [Streptomyces sp. S186]|uniref:ABC transporter substrate-binding protein n=1 Tax=Streptomyces sp. S186 TaxID=3434395 RepID=UPI003F673B1F